MRLLLIVSVPPLLRMAPPVTTIWFVFLLDDCRLPLRTVRLFNVRSPPAATRKIRNGGVGEVVARAIVAPLPLMVIGLVMLGRPFAPSSVLCGPVSWYIQAGLSTIMLSVLSGLGLALAVLIALIRSRVAVVPQPTGIGSLDASATRTGDFPSKNDPANSTPNKSDATEAKTFIRGVRALPARTSDKNLLFTACTFLMPPAGLVATVPPYVYKHP